MRTTRTHHRRSTRILLAAVPFLAAACGSEQIGTSLGSVGSDTVGLDTVGLDTTVESSVGMVLTTEPPLILTPLPIPPEVVDRDLGPGAARGSVEVDGLPEPARQAFEIDLDLGPLRGVATDRAESVALTLPGVGRVIAVFQPLYDPFASAPWPAIRYDEPTEEPSAHIIRVTEEAWIDGIPIRAVLTEPVDPLASPTIELYGLSRVVTVGPCPASNVQPVRMCMVDRESLVLEPGASDDTPPSITGEGDTPSLDPFIGLPVDD